MPKGEPNKNTVRVDRYQKKAGYKVKSFKLKGDLAERFAEACDKAGVSQAAKISELMEKFISDVEQGQ
ncbi:hypothetical protein [Butyrivibrio sp. NC2002]|uniref:hypothetical protein n=1 Tax=Butyrivibrio sp. NC2002 TaxID=1410610 RepID=UPI00055AFB2D|nr:hypothetical protein [Butyrivibrio sp. NC2002]